MKNVNKVIFEALSAHRNVALPGIGSLEVKRTGARRLSERELATPRNEVVFSVDAPAEVSSIVDIIATDGALSTDEAQGAYDAWLTGARTGQGVIIDEVGEIRGGEFIPAEAMTAALNPTNEPNTVTMEKVKSTKKGRVWAWILIPLVVIAAALLWCNHKGCFGKLAKKGSKTEVVAPAAKATEAVTGEGTEPAADEMLDAAVDAGKSASEKVAAGAAGVAAGAAKVAAGAATTTSTKGSPSTTGVKTATADGKWHVIAGSFAIESNADNLIARIRKNHPALNPVKIKNRRNGYTMVSIYSSADEHDAYNHLKHYWDIDLYLWVYRAR